MFNRYAGAEIICNNCGEEKSYEVNADQNVTEKDIKFEEDLKRKGWTEVNEEIHLCPNCSEDYGQAKDKEDWLAENDVTGYY